jgi:PiT family inorganic phosphate transporter
LINVLAPMGIGALLAYVNGANDISKSIATRVGSGVTPATAALAVLVGASGWVALATRTGLPVSTTHALVGSLVGVIWWVQGADAIRWNELGDKIFLPLLLSPLAALALTAGCARLLRPDPQAEVSDCLCVGSRPNTLALGNTTLTLSVSPSVTVGRVSSRTA